MAPATKFYLVSADALPEIFIKVAEAKRMLQSGEVRTAGDAARAVGISRSAFYKYRDAVRPFNDMQTCLLYTSDPLSAHPDREVRQSTEQRKERCLKQRSFLLTIGKREPVHRTGSLVFRFAYR